MQNLTLYVILTYCEDDNNNDGDSDIDSEKKVIVIVKKGDSDVVDDNDKIHLSIDPIQPSISTIIYNHHLPSISSIIYKHNLSL